MTWTDKALLTARICVTYRGAWGAMWTHSPAMARTLQMVAAVAVGWFALVAISTGNAPAGLVAMSLVLATIGGLARAGDPCLLVPSEEDYRYTHLGEVLLRPDPEGEGDDNGDLTGFLVSDECYEMAVWLAKEGKATLIWV